mmetsp:Transcript_72805/g.189543  ORF Transcript_72805/g.189543 Transcript_72805/m.189543 type:complete len:359 (+) Transcript_72805:102-1178(+)
MMHASMRNTFLEFSAGAAEEFQCIHKLQRSRSEPSMRSDVPAEVEVDAELGRFAVHRLNSWLTTGKSVSLAVVPPTASVETTTPTPIAVAPANLAVQKQAWQPSRDRRARAASDGVQAGMEATTLGVGRKMSAALTLKNVQSNSSVSTMAPQDWDSEEDDNYHEEQQWHHQGHCELETVGEECQRPYQGHGVQQMSGFNSWTPRVFQHAKVPRSQNLVAQFSKANIVGLPTTMMVRNIPNRYTQRELIREIEVLGFGESFDFFYAPMDTGTMGNVGYAFVNFVDGTWAERCQQMLSGYTFKKHQKKTRTKVASVSVAHLQGLEANLRHYEKAAINSRGRSKHCGQAIKTSLASALASL